MKKLLIVDDEPEIVDFLSSFFLERNDYEVSTASSVEKAFEMLKQKKPDMVLQDLKMRGNKGGGFEVLQKAKEVSPKSKFIMVTALEDQASISEAMNLGAVDYITKPLSLEYLETTVIEKLKEITN